MSEASPAAVAVAARPRLAVSDDGRLAAWTESERIVILALPKLSVAAEIGIHADALETDVAFVGTPPRLVVLSRHADAGWLHVIDPRGPAKLGEVSVPAAARIAATAGDLVLLASGVTASIVDTSKRKPNAAVLPLRDAVTAAAPFGPGRFLILVRGVVEDWDGNARAPARRFHFGEVIAARFLGGSAQRLWFVPTVGEDRIEIRTLTGAPAPQRILVPQPIVRVVAGPHPDALIALTPSGNALVIDLQGRRPIAPVRPEPVVDAVWESPTSLLVIDGSRMVRVPLDIALPVPIAPREVEDEPGDEEGGVALPEPIARTEREPARASARASGEAPIRDAPAAAPKDPPATDEVGEGTGDRQSPAQRLSAWRKRVGGAPLAASPPSAAPTSAPAPMPLAAATGAGWRNDLVTWAGAILEGRALDSPPPSAGALARIAAQLELDEHAARGLGLAYGAYLRGVDRLAPLHLARIFNGWDEAVGGGALGTSGALRWARRAIVIAPEVLAALDERSPLCGTILHGTGKPRAGALVVPGELGVPAIARWAATLTGDLLVPSRRGLRLPRAFVREARVRGLAPLVPWATLGETLEDPPTTAVIIVEDHEVAARLELAVIAVWDGGDGEDA
ncbi:MAG: hypothetical protein K8W52_46240 [Deltaproteobacteria bacterium]|nr:hypothetical protein [Deltaproteobacteria bacterium]